MVSCQVGGSYFSHVSSTRVIGNGNLVSKEYEINDYSGISIENSTNVFYEQKEDVKPYLRVETDDNLLPYYSVEVKDDMLVLKSTENVNTKHCVVYTNSKSLSEIRVSGVSNIELGGKISSDNLVFNLSGVTNINAPDLRYDKVTVNFSGVGNIIMGGTTQKTLLNINGKGNIHAYNLNTENAVCNMMGVGKIEVFATQKLTASMSGVGNIRYKGNPQKTELHKNGVGSIKAE